MLPNVILITEISQKWFGKQQFLLKRIINFFKSLLGENIIQE